MHTRRRQIARRAMRIVIVAKNRHRLAGADPPAVQIGAHRTRRHDARAVVVLKRNRPLQRARRQDRLLGDDPPETLQRRARAAVAMMLPTRSNAPNVP